jgi:hypothetical protein
LGSSPPGTASATDHKTSKRRGNFFYFLNINRDRRKKGDYEEETPEAYHLANDITMKELFITNPYHNMRIVPGDKMVVIGEILDMDLKKTFGGLLGATVAMINREHNNVFAQVDKKAGLRKICMDNIA